MHLIRLKRLRSLPLRGVNNGKCLLLRCHWFIDSHFSQNGENKMIFINDFIPLLSAFLEEFSFFLFPLIALAFLCTVPYLIRAFFKVR